MCGRAKSTGHVEAQVEFATGCLMGILGMGNVVNRLDVSCRMQAKHHALRCEASSAGGLELRGEGWSR